MDRGDATASRALLAVNSGSSSIKYAVFPFEADAGALVRGSLDVADRRRAAEDLLRRIAADIERAPLAGIGHRIVHGGPTYHEPTVIDSDVVDELKRVVPFAPNHLPDEIALIEALGHARPDLPQFACFDTGFHHEMPEVSRRLPIPAAFAAAGVRRYGFHGLSYAYLAQELQRVAGMSIGRGKVIVAHLGNGSSLAALRDGKSVDTSMGFTPIGGVVMSTRTGDLDPGVVTHIARSSGLTADRLEQVLSHESGLRGISNGTADMKTLLAREADDPACALAVAIYCYEVRKRIGAYAAALGGVDTIVFSGGIGEHAAPVRARICADLRFLGVAIHDRRNAEHAPVISTDDARVEVRVIPTDEERVIARAGRALLH